MAISSKPVQSPARIRYLPPPVVDFSYTCGILLQLQFLSQHLNPCIDRWWQPLTSNRHLLKVQLLGNLVSSSYPDTGIQNIKKEPTERSVILTELKLSRAAINLPNSHRPVSFRAVMHSALTQDSFDLMQLTTRPSPGCTSEQ